MRTILFLLLFIGVAFAQEQEQTNYYTSNEIQSAVLTYLKEMPDFGKDQGFTFQTGKIDSRLKLPRCHVPLNLQMSHINEVNHRAVVQVNCNGVKPWSINVPVQAEYTYNVIVTTSHLSGGTVLTEDDLTTATRKQQSNQTTVYHTREELIGKVLKRTANQGQIVTSSMIETPLLIKKGQSVEILAQKGNLLVTMPGVALQDGQLNQEIEVKNKKSKRVLEAKVIGHNQVMVEF